MDDGATFANIVHRFGHAMADFPTDKTKQFGSLSSADGHQGYVGGLDDDNIPMSGCLRCLQSRFFFLSFCVFIAAAA
jgi:hypothetical protein